MINRTLNDIEEWLIELLMGAATIAIFLAVVHRFASGAPWVQDYTVKPDVSWAQELCIYMFVWMAKFGAAYGVRQGPLVGTDVVVRARPASKAKWLILFGLVAGAVFTDIVGTLGARSVWENGFHHAFVYSLLGMDVGDVPEDATSPDLEIPTWIAYSCVPLGSYLMCYRFMQVAWQFLRTVEVPHHDHAVWHHEDGHHRVDGCGRALAADDGRVPGRRNLPAYAVALAPAHTVQMSDSAHLVLGAGRC